MSSVELGSGGEEYGGGNAEDRSGDREWIEFAHVEKRRFYSFDEARAEIVRQMDRLAGKNKGIVPQPVGMRIYSPNVPDLTLVDLPGLVKTPQGDQPLDIEAQIRAMWFAYIGNPNTVVLAVHAANMDIHTDDAIRCALEVDPTGERTIGVLTKIDLMDPGTDARDVISGRVLPLKRGFVPLVCRSQKDTADGLPIERALQKEARFFTRHPAYQGVAARCGASYLTRQLSSLLIASVRTWLPRFRADLATGLQVAEQSLRELGPAVDPALDASKAGQTVLRLLSRYAANYNDMLDGRVHADASDEVLTQVLFGGARIQEHIRSRFYPTVELWMNNFVTEAHRTLPSAEILMALRNSSGPRPTLFIPENAFVALCRRYIRTLKQIGRDFVKSVYNELRYAADVCRPPELNRFNQLRDQAVEVVHDMLHKAFSPTVEAVDALIDFELSHINTLHPDFVGAEGAMQRVRSGDDLKLFRHDPWLAALDAATAEAAEQQGNRRSRSRGSTGGRSLFQKDRRGSGVAQDGEEDASDAASGDSDLPSHRRRRASRADDPSEEEGPDRHGHRSGSRASSNGRDRSEGGNHSSGAVSDDVRWAVEQVGGRLDPQPFGKPGSEAAFVDAPPQLHADDEEDGPSAGSPVRYGSSRQRSRATSGAEEEPSSPGTAAVLRNNGAPRPSQFIRDVHDRFQSDMVPDITGHGPDDPVPAGALRLGGMHSPYVARPVSRLGGAGGAGVVGGPASSAVAYTPRMGGSPQYALHGGSPGTSPAGAALSASPSSYPYPSVAASAYAAAGGAYGFGMPSAGVGGGILGPHMGGLPQAYAGAAGSPARSEYTHYEISQLPVRPLPALITPDHLRPTAKERVEIRVIRYLLYSYLSIIKKTYQDVVPKMVMSLLVNRSREEINAELIQRLYASITQVSRDLLLREADDVAAQRRVLAERIHTLRRGLTVLNEVRESSAQLQPGAGYFVPQGGPSSEPQAAQQSFYQTQHMPGAVGGAAATAEAYADFTGGYGNPNTYPGGMDPSTTYMGGSPPRFTAGPAGVGAGGSGAGGFIGQPLRPSTIMPQPAIAPYANQPGAAVPVSASAFLGRERDRDLRAGNADPIHSAAMGFAAPRETLRHQPLNPGNVAGSGSSMPSFSAAPGEAMLGPRVSPGPGGPSSLGAPPAMNADGVSPVQGRVKSETMEY
jgi:replication fork clamp-binding protein CrfC